MENTNKSKVRSFEIDHTRLRPGLYSHIDLRGGRCVTTFDLRLVQPNCEEDPPLPNAVMHTIEHIGAHYLRSRKDWGNSIIYFGPMGCRTGFYAVIDGPHQPEERLMRDLFMSMAKEIANWPKDKPIPGASPEKCGNWRDHNIMGAKKAMQKWLRIFDTKNLDYYPFSYPE